MWLKMLLEWVLVAIELVFLTPGKVLVAFVSPGMVLVNPGMVFLNLEMVSVTPEMVFVVLVVFVTESQRCNG